MATDQQFDTSSKSYAAACGSNYSPTAHYGETRNAHSVERSGNTFSPEINPEALDQAQKFYEMFSYALTKMHHRGDMFKLWNDAHILAFPSAKDVDFNKVLYAMAFGLKVCRVKQNTQVLWKVNRPRDDEQPRYRDDRGRRDEQPRYRDDRGRRDEQPRYRDDRGRREEQPRYRDDRGRREEQPRYRDDRDSQHSRWDRN